MRDIAPGPVRAWTREERRQATRLRARRNCAQYRVQFAMAARKWILAAAWEERVVLCEHELALLENARASPVVCEKPIRTSATAATAIVTG